MHAVPYWRLSAYYFSYYAFLGVFSPYFALYLQSLGLSAWDIGLLMSQMQLMRLCGPYVWGGVADRCGRRLMIVRTTGAVACVSFLVFFISQRFEPLLAAMAVFAFFWSASMPLVEALTFDHLREQAPRYSRIRLWGSIGFVVAVLVVGALLDFLPVTSLPWLCLFTLLVILGSSARLTEAKPLPHAVSDPSLGDVLALPHVRALFVGCFAMTAAHGALNIFYTLFLDAHGVSKSVVGALWTLGVLAEIGVFLVMARVMRRFDLRTILLFSLAAAVLRFVLIGYGVGSLAVLAFAQLLHGLTFGACHAAAIAAVNRWFTGATRGRGQALYSGIAFGAGGLVGGLLSGALWDRIGGELTFAVSSLFALFGYWVVARWVRTDDVGAPPGARVVRSS